MRRRLAGFALCCLAAAGIWGSAVGVVQLRRAITRSDDLYRLDTVASLMEGELEFETQESRRAFLYGLTTPDPNEQLPYIDAAREADSRVRAGSAALRSLNHAGAIAAHAAKFDESWNRYSSVRDEIVAEILSGDSQRALAIERQRGNPAFTDALRNLHELKDSLEAHAHAQSQMVHQTLRNCIFGLAFFVVSMSLIVTALIAVNRKRGVAARSLQRTNQALEKAQELDRRRVEILEMIGMHSPIARTLSAIAELAGRAAPGAGAAIWSATGGSLLYQVGANLPPDLLNVLRTCVFALRNGQTTAPLQPPRAALKAAQAAGLAHGIVPLRNVAGDSIGLLMFFTPSGPGTADAAETVKSQVAGLASLAIENTLLYERLAFQAQHDVLTGLPNRLLFQDRVQQAIRLAQRNRRKAAVLWLDLDRFKSINDTLGHRVGDELLCEAARRIRQSIRESDSAARIGGDEFVVLASDLDGTTDATLIAEKILQSLRSPMRLSGHDVRISASIGIGVFPEHGIDPAALMRNADLAMYNAKHAGRDASQVFLPEFSDSLDRRLQVEQQLKGALDAGEFRLTYQPLIDRSDRLEGFEALLRWTNPCLGEVSPSEFIPIAEDIGLIGRIGEWVTLQACRAGSRWIEAGLDVPRIAVNVSGLQFTDPRFAETVRSALHESGFPPSKFEIEVTETALVNHLPSALEQIARLRQLGIKFAIDDFGTGYSSLNQLRTLPVDYVKVDRSFIKELDGAAGDATTLVRGIIGLAHNLQLNVVAEGVETEQQLAILRSLGCDISQGFYLYRPLTPEDAEELLRHQDANVLAKEEEPAAV